MKRWLVILLIPIMLVQSNMMLIIFTSFYYNKNYIEKYLCVQRNMENNTCHGQCYLMKKLKTQQEKEQSNFKINFQEAAIAKIDFTDAMLPLVFPITKQPFFQYQETLPLSQHEGVFRPPLAV